jgi:glycosyltransferase involved in cell wall biosynthesis
MEISCVIPAFENLDLFARCLASVAAQNAPDLEIVVTDDSKSARIRRCVDGFSRMAANVRYLEGPRTGNPVDNWNHGLDQARGAFSVVVHHDEFLVDPTYLGRAAARLRQGDAAAVLGRATVTGVTRPSRFRLATTLATAMGRPVWLLPILNWVGPTAAFVFRAGPRFEPALVQLTDVEFYRRVLATGRLEVLPGVCVGSLGHHRDQITARIDPAAEGLADLRRLAERRPPAINATEFRIYDACLRLQSWIRRP